MNDKFLCKVSCKNSHSLLRYQQNTAGSYFFWPHPVVRSIPRWRPAVILKISIVHIFAMHFPLHFTSVGLRRTYTFPSDALKTLDAYEIYLEGGGGRNESTCVVKRKNETADLEKYTSDAFL